MRELPFTPPRRPGRAERGGRVSLVVPVALAGLVSLLGLRRLDARAAVEDGYGWIDPAALALGPLPPWADPRWGEELDHLLRGLPPVRTDDRAGQEELARAIESLSFVARARIEGVRWPDGLALELWLERPVACVPVGPGFQPVAADGTLLSGRWSAPPFVGAAPLPVIGPLSDGRGLFDLARPGDWLAEPEHRDALDVALSLEEHLDREERAALGRLVIDARRARRAAVDEPGVRLLLEGGRIVLFGRAPGCGEPGELPVRAKWRSLSRALALPGADWAVVDVRWDRPEIVLRQPPAAADSLPLAAAAPPRAALDQARGE
ncbi:MAG: hypothetical protein AB1726_03410, partial [Planctomycetota bacterium]